MVMTNNLLVDKINDYLIAIKWLIQVLKIVKLFALLSTQSANVILYV